MAPKKTLSVFLTIMIVSALFFVGTAPFSTAREFTPVIGKLSSDRSWTKANSPYIFRDQVTVAEGVTLTIEPGVTIEMGPFWLNVWGALHARGTVSDNIVFISSSHGSSNMPGHIYFDTNDNQQTILESIIENAIINVTYHPAISIFKHSPKINNNTIHGTIESHSTGSTLITKNNIMGSIYVGSGSKTIISNNIISGGFGISGGSNYTIIFNNTIIGCNIGIGIERGAPIIEKNLITSNNIVGIKVRSGQPIIKTNTITNNLNGVLITQDFGDSCPIIHNNNIYSNNQYDLKLDIPNDVDATSNWWGTNDKSTIGERIHDYNDDPKLGNVNYTPFLMAPNPKAPTTPDFIPTISIQTSYPPTTPLPTPYPSANESDWDWNIIGIFTVGILVALVIVVIAYMRKRTRALELKHIGKESS